MLDLSLWENKNSKLGCSLVSVGFFEVSSNCWYKMQWLSLFSKTRFSNSDSTKLVLFLRCMTIRKLILAEFEIAKSKIS